jgi:tetratricopeptide (TPR) repeat protein
MVTTGLPESPHKHLPKLVNRTVELAQLLQLVPPRRSRSSFVILEAPSGYGKTRLTSQLIELLTAEGILAVVLEPQIRSKRAADSVYQGFYIQRCAEALDQRVRLPNCRLLAMPFEEFLKIERTRRATSLNWKRFFRQLPSLKTAYEVGVELVDRIFNTGEHSTGKVLTSDSREAVDTCARYIKYVVGITQMVLVVREAQHVDQSSLQLLSEIAGPQTSNCAILEYTLDATGALNPLFSDFLEAAPLNDMDWLHIVELVRLSKPHLEELLRQTLPGTSEISGEYYLHWDGNVRSIRQLRFSISIERGRSAPQLLDLKRGVIEEYQQQISRLAPTDRMSLCLLFTHEEAIPRSLVRLLLGKLNVLAAKGAVDHSLTGLIEAELVVAHPIGTLSLENEDIAEAIRKHTALAGNLLLAKAVLRDYYRSLVCDTENPTPDMSLAVRQALRLSVDLGDVATMEEVVTLLSSRVSTTTDQSWYVSQIVTAIGGGAHLFADQHDNLLLWAAEMAAEIADVKTARDLLRQMSSNSSFSDVLLCACLIETGDHEEAARLSNLLAMSADRDEQLAGELIKLILLRCTGQIGAARELWGTLDSQADLRKSNLYGYLLRFKELVADFPDCIEALRSSSDWFILRRLATSAAYTELTLASHTARSGDIGAANDSIDKARELLASTARDQHILSNNEVAVHLLSEKPDAVACCNKLARAIPCSGDDYSDIVLYTNFAISAALIGRTDQASEAVERALRIAKKPKFADRDVFWGVSFNLCYVDATLRLGRKMELIEAFGELEPHSLQNDYWQYRIGRAESSHERFRFMLSKPYHPMFLSHWTLDVDGLRALRREHAPALPGSSNPSA